MTTTTKKKYVQKPIGSRCLTAEETYKIIDWLATERILMPNVPRCMRDTCMILLMLDAGLRVGEINKLNVVDLWKFEQPVESLFVSAEISKSKRDRTVPLSFRVRKAIQDIHDKIWTHYDYTIHSAAFVTGFFQQRITIRQTQRIVNDIGTLAIKRHLTPHMLRHTFATRLMRTTNVRIVQTLLGHTSLSSTQIYTHPDSDDLKKAITGLD